ncbi:uncharacterized protein LOC111319425 [Stylophora pistillata]|uniref:uncharacterized protein LOC111319425 n=1 Tax=Stylophora pistillata TaxID=50429 RepID=UPI000C03BB89|nr:uncharacterized protein LOC111319425 [Stylophora pistillata]
MASRFQHQNIIMRTGAENTQTDHLKDAILTQHRILFGEEIFWYQVRVTSEIHQKQEIEIKICKEKMKWLSNFVIDDYMNLIQSFGNIKFVVLPKSKIAAVLDSKPEGFVKPSTQNVMNKIGAVLAESNFNVGDWTFACNMKEEVPQQTNDFDCGVYICLYARC